MSHSMRSFNSNTSNGNSTLRRMGGPSWLRGTPSSRSSSGSRDTLAAAQPPPQMQQQRKSFRRAWEAEPDSWTQSTSVYSHRAASISSHQSAFVFPTWTVGNAVSDNASTASCGGGSRRLDTNSNCSQAPEDRRTRNPELDDQRNLSSGGGARWAEDGRHPPQSRYQDSRAAYSQEEAPRYADNQRSGYPDSQQHSRAPYQHEQEPKCADNQRGRYPDSWQSRFQDSRPPYPPEQEPRCADNQRSGYPDSRPSRFQDSRAPYRQEEEQRCADRYPGGDRAPVSQYPTAAPPMNCRPPAVAVQQAPVRSTPVQPATQPPPPPQPPPPQQPQPPPPPPPPQPQPQQPQPQPHIPPGVQGNPMMMPQMPQMQQLPAQDPQRNAPALAASGYPPQGQHSRFGASMFDDPVGEGQDDEFGPPPPNFSNLDSAWPNMSGGLENWPANMDSGWVDPVANFAKIVQQDPVNDKDEWELPENWGDLDVPPTYPQNMMLDPGFEGNGGFGSFNNFNSAFMGRGGGVGGGGGGGGAAVGAVAKAASAAALLAALMMI
ncbi:hypothetical protein BOX15_Mlig011584g1 [Macrostomum lignano]|uniref:Uncharacterized protein n=1 Tax=Macrostomum lignano TaxID=282301 RepID=A0A267GJX5_9PLAT|nr:hypothetical protein BOX15_Mlig011584g1 [Macrostomum lignano]